MEPDLPKIVKGGLFASVGNIIFVQIFLRNLIVFLRDLLMRQSSSALWVVKVLKELPLRAVINHQELAVRTP